MNQREEILRLLSEGNSLSEICRRTNMPSRETVRLWQREDAEFDLAVTCAREDGYEHRAEQAILAAKTAEDAAKGRLAFDAERWFLGKLSNAFSDDKARKHELSGPGGQPIETTFKVEFVRANGSETS